MKKVWIIGAWSTQSCSQFHTVAFEKHWTALNLAFVNEMVFLAIRFQFLHNFVFLFLKSFWNVYNWPQSVFPFYFKHMNRFSFLLFPIVLILLFIYFVKTAYNLPQFVSIWFYFVITNIIFNNVIRLMFEWILSLKF